MSDPMHSWINEMKYALEVLNNVRDDVRLEMVHASEAARVRFAELDHQLDDQQRLMGHQLIELTARFHALKHQLVVPPEEPPAEGAGKFD